MVDDSSSEDFLEVIGQETIDALKELGFEPHRKYEARVDFERVPRGSFRSRRFLQIAIELLEILERQIRFGPSELHDRFGFTDSTGLYEAQLLSENSQDFARLRTLATDTPICERDHQEIDSMRHLESLEVTPIHLAAPSEDVCIELSQASPVGELFSTGLPFTLHSSYPLNTITLKVMTDPDIDRKSLIELGNSLTDAFIYELAVRHQIIARPARRQLGAAINIFTPRAKPTPLRYPAVAIRGEVAQLFNAAITTRNNNLAAFLSFYQVLEYYFPRATERTTIRKVRGEIADPSFTTASDDDILRIIKLATSAAGTPNNKEAAQISTLLQEWVRADRLQEFFTDSLAPHFGNSGPIKGVGTITTSPRADKPLAKQVADRVYQLRNRIVHAKDDPKYADTRVLLPFSDEAQHLGPDVSLVGLLAQEVINSAQLQA